MSAPLPGRQSPDPETQTGAQQQDPPSAGREPDEYKPKDPEYAKRQSDKEKFHDLRSNPVHPLEIASHAKYAR